MKMTFYSEILHTWKDKQLCDQGDGLSPMGTRVPWIPIPPGCTTDQYFYRRPRLPAPPHLPSEVLRVCPSFMESAEENQSCPLKPEPTQSMSFLDIQRMRRKKQPSIFDMAVQKKLEERQQAEENDSAAAFQQQQNNSVSKSLPNTFPLMMHKTEATRTNNGAQNQTILEVRNMTPDSVTATGDESRERGGGHSVPLAPQQQTSVGCRPFFDDPLQQSHLQNKCVESGYGSM